jgi:hypothetical protein
MNLPLTKKDTISFTPDSYADTPNPPIYHIGVATIAGRADFRRKIREEGITYPDDTLLLNTLREGVKTVVSNDQQPEIIELIDIFECSEKKDAELIAKIEDIERQITNAYPPYATLCAARDYFSSISPIIAVRCFLKGITNGAKYTTKNGIISDETLEAIPENDLLQIGYKAIALQSVSKEQAKNSGSPSQSVADPETLTAVE